MIAEREHLESEISRSGLPETDPGLPEASKTSIPGVLRVSVLTAGRDRPYALGLASALILQGVPFDFIGSDEVNGPELHDNSLVNFLNLRGDQRADAGMVAKVTRVIAYYVRLIAYATRAEAKIFHILWNNKFEWFDRTLLMVFYRLLGKRIVFTAHNVNAGERDASDSWFNRLTLRIQYRLCDQIVVQYGTHEDRTCRPIRTSQRPHKRHSVWHQQHGSQQRADHL